MRKWCYLVAPVVLCVCTVAPAQTLKAYQVSPVFDEDLSVAPSVAVGPTSVVIAGTHWLKLYDKSLALSHPDFLDDERVWWPSHPADPAQMYPFRPRVTPDPGSAMSLIFPRADYDPISGRTWMLFSEVGAVEEELFEYTGGVICSPYLHLAVSKDPTGSVTTFGDTDWWYYTGNQDSLPTDPTAPGNGGEAFNVGEGGISPFSAPGHDGGVAGVSMVPSMAFDIHSAFIATSESGICSPPFTFNSRAGVIILPREHDDETKSILDGDRPLDGDLRFARLADLDERDDAKEILAVQEPYEQHPNVTLFISSNGDDKLRLRGIYNTQPDPTQGAGAWLARQSLKMNGTDIVLADMDVLAYAASVPGLELDTFAISPVNTSLYPRAADSTRPAVHGDMFTSAILTLDNQRNPRVFAVHAARDESFSAFGWVVQWYVIDPKLDTFYTLTPEGDTTWNPTIVAAGRIKTDGSSQPADGDCYMPALGVTRSGQVFIEYTFSNDFVHPKIIRAVLNNTYTGVGFTTVAQNGPLSGYGDADTWALYPDMQADPFGCFFWSTHTLVDSQTARAAWLFKSVFNCFQPDLNADGVVNPYDLAIYQNLFLDGHRGADTDADEVVDPFDLINYVHAYDAATSP